MELFSCARPWTSSSVRLGAVWGEREKCAENVRDSTSAKVSTDGPDGNSQHGPEHIEARLRADRSSVAGCVRCCRYRADNRRAGEKEKDSKDRRPRNRARRAPERARRLHRGKPVDSDVQ